MSDQQNSEEYPTSSASRLPSADAVLRGSPLANPTQPSVNNSHIPSPSSVGSLIPSSSPHQQPPSNSSTSASIKSDPVAVIRGYKNSKTLASSADRPSPPGPSISPHLENRHWGRISPANSPTNDTADHHVMNDPHSSVSLRQLGSSISLKTDFLRAGSPYNSSPADTLNGDGPQGSSLSARVNLSDTYSTQSPTPGNSESAFSPSHPSPSAGTKKRASVGSAAPQMSKWLPPSTSVLAEALEKNFSTPLASRTRFSSVDAATLAGGLLTPPFTPLRKLDEQGSMRTPVRISSPADKRMRPQTCLITPPATLPHQPNRPFAGSRSTPLDFLSDSDSASPTRASPRSAVASGRGKPSNSSRTLANQLKQLALSENSRQRSSSTPTGPEYDFNPGVSPQRPPLPSSLISRHAEHAPSASITAAEHRKRAETISTSVSGASISKLAPQGLIPRRVSVASFQPHELGLGRIGSTNPGGDSSQMPIYSPSSSSIFASNLPSALAFSHPPSSYPLALGSGLDQGPNLSPQRAHAPFDNSSPHSGPGQSHISERRQRYHTAPTDGSSLKDGSSQELHGMDSDMDVNYSRPSSFGGRRESPSHSNADTFQIEAVPFKYANSRLRPRSSTMAGVGNLRMLKKSLLSMRWNDEEIDEGVEGDTPKLASNSSPSGKTVDSARSSSSTEDVDPMKKQHPVNHDSSRSLYERRASETSLLPRALGWNSSGSLLTRYCKILGLAPKLLGSMKGIVSVRNAFARYGDLLDIYVDTLSPLGFILVGFHDVRSILHLIEQGQPELGALFGSYLKFEPIQRHEVIQMIQDVDNPILSTNEATLKLYFDDPRGIVTHDVLNEYLTRHGELKILKNVAYNQWHVEYYDDRRAEAAQEQLASRDFADFHVSVTTLEGDVGPTFTSPRGPIGPPHSLNDQISFNPVINPNVCMLPPTIRPPTGLINPTDPYNNGLLYRYMADPYAGNCVFPWSPPISGAMASLYPHPPPVNSVEPLSFPAPLVHPNDRFPSVPPQMDLQKHQHMVAAATHRPRAFPFPGVPPSNVIDLDRIECGSDPRTTCMIKNIPNKITDEMLYNFINEICPRGFDFLYLRMDFKARLNVGYAFINFLSVENVLKFAKAKLGVKWGVFLSEKTVQMCYASIQGKENLIEKFRNSAIMEEEDSFRPKVYHSSGPLVGLPEPFPHANDLQRKARSQANAALAARPSIPSTIGVK